MTIFLGPLVGDKDRLDAIAKWVSGASNTDEAQEYDYGNLSITTDKYAEADYENLELNRTGIFGLPYQFNNTADVPLGSMYPGTSNANKFIGRVFEEHIFANMPIIYFEVGKPLFMDALSGDKSTTSWVMQALQSASSLANGLTFGDASLDTVFEKSSLKNWLFNSSNQLRYYGFKDDFLNYADYVNSMARFVAIKMGIGDSPCMLMGEKKRYRDFDIKQIKNRFLVTNLLNCLANTATSYHIPLYCTANGTYVSENASNTVGESMLSATVKNGSQLAKEISFLLNTATPEVSDSAVQGVTNLIEGITGGFSADGALGFIRKLGTIGKTVVNSANMMFPAIWQDSTFSKSYSISAKFSSPYGDAYSIFNDVYVPFLCLLAMTLPRQYGSAGYGSPFIIKAHSKGYFNCDMGIIESLEVKRGGESGNDWSYNGLPTSIEVNLTIKDLYPAIVATQAKASTFMFAGNSGLIDYLNMMAGLNLTSLDPFSNIDAGVQMILSDVYNIWGELGYTINHKIYSNLKYISDGFFS